MRIVKETGKPVAHIARDLGINEYTLYNWVQMDRHSTGQVGRDGNGGGKLKESEQEELARLRREKAELVKQHAKDKAAWERERAELEDERDVLKRSVVLWVKDSLNR
ncbi:transposase [Nonomuraea sp. NBC_00507]|uniref:transposase n=1 Tax=Nonomuraea sp. NBC_00507 TaxID=2976002 RepID=UPI002E16D90A